MSGTQLFKNTNRNIHRKRYMTDENQFSKGYAVGFSVIKCCLNIQSCKGKCFPKNRYF